MSTVTPVGAAAPGAAPSAEAARLRRACQDMEGVFMRHLFQAMRDSVPDEGILGVSASEQIFTEMFDDAVADEAARHLTNGLGEALFRQLGRGLDTAAPPARPAE